jgi:hypothetical protein
MSRLTTPVLFFYDLDLLEFWGNLSADDMFGQQLYRSYAQSRFPRLFSSSEGKQMGLVARLARRAMAAARPSATRRSSARQGAGVIEHERIIQPNRDNILGLLDRVAPMAAGVLDVAAFRTAVSEYGMTSTNKISSGNMIRAVNTFFLLDLVNAPDSE